MSSTLMTEIVPEHPLPGRSNAIKPPRLNFARRCLYCLERDCESPKCEAMYARSRWGVCPDCDGRQGDELTSVPCRWCVFGVVELAPMPAARGESVGGLVELR
jgi:hypothetical protein